MSQEIRTLSDELVDLIERLDECFDTKLLTPTEYDHWANIKFTLKNGQQELEALLARTEMDNDLVDNIDEDDLDP